MKAWMLKQRKAGTESQARPPTTGQLFEDRALAFLQSRGLELVERNFSCRLGEIDLVMLDTNILVFVEVKYRRKSRYGHAAEQVTASKRKKLVNSALVFLSCRDKYASLACRFDVVGISPGPDKTNINWITNAIDTT
jgi:putative endonuclease